MRNPSKGTQDRPSVSLHTFDKDLTSRRLRFPFTAAKLYNSVFYPLKFSAVTPKIRRRIRVGEIMTDVPEDLPEESDAQWHDEDDME